MISEPLGYGLSGSYREHLGTVQPTMTQHEGPYKNPDCATEGRSPLVLYPCPFLITGIFSSQDAQNDCCHIHEDHESAHGPHRSKDDNPSAAFENEILILINSVVKFPMSDWSQDFLLDYKAKRENRDVNFINHSYTLQ